MKLKKGFLKSLCSLILIISMIMSGNLFVNGEDNNTSKEIEISSDYTNRVQNYDTNIYGQCTTSFINKTDFGIETAEYYDNKLYVQYLDNNFNFITSKVIDIALPIWGGLYFGEENNYIVTGQHRDNDIENGGEVYRITKYDKDFNKLGKLSIYSDESYTLHPFYFGNVSIALQGNKLLVYTSRHRLDGHQSNILFKINTDTMELFDKNSMSDFPDNHVSHSLYQRVMFDDENIFCADVSDGYPKRSVYYNNSKISGSVLDIPGGIGDNITYTELNGIEMTDNYYLIAGMSELKSAVNNAYIACVNKTNGDVLFNWLTDSDMKYNIIGGLKLVKISNNEFVVMWQSGIHQASYYVIDEKGNKLCNEKKVYVNGLSDCQPIFCNNSIIWNYTEHGNLYIEQIDDFSHDSNILPLNEMVESDVYWNGTSDTSWYSDEKNIFEINNAEELAGLSELVNNGNDFTGKVINLKKDIFLNNMQFNNCWTPIAVCSDDNSDLQFNGVFDGKGHSIYNLYTYNKGLGGLFGKIGNEGIVINLNIKQSKLCCGGAFANINNGIIAYCDNYSIVCDLYTNKNKPNIGGICNINYNYIYGCVNYGAVKGAFVGGIAGYNLNTIAVISQCCNKGYVGAYDYASGIVQANYAWVYNCNNTQIVSDTYYDFENDSTIVQLNTAKAISGIVGTAGTYSNMENCYFAGILSYTKNCWYAHMPIFISSNENINNCYSYDCEERDARDNSIPISYTELTSPDMINKLDGKQHNVLSAWKEDTLGINKGMPITMADYYKSINNCKYQPEIWINGGDKPERNIDINKTVKAQFYYNENIPTVIIEDNSVAKADITKEECIITGKKKGTTKITIIIPEGNYSSEEKYEFKLCVSSGESETTEFRETETEPVSTTERISLSKCKITLSESRYNYDGKAKKPKVTIKYGNATLKSGSDYTLKYKNNKNAGKASVLIQAVRYGKYVGEVEKTFTINKINPILKVGKKHVKIDFKNSKFKVSLTTNTDGKITYSSSNSNIAAVNKSGLIKPKKAGTCTITVNASEGKNYYSQKATFTVNITKLKEQSIKCKSRITKTYGDSEFNLGIHLKDNPKITYITGDSTIVKVNKNGDVKIKGAGKTKIYIYVKGTKKYYPINKAITINVTKASIKNVKVKLRKEGDIEWGTFDEDKDIEVTYKGRKLKNGKDYYVGSMSGAASNNIYTYIRVQLNGRGNYTGIKQFVLIKK